MLSFLQLTQLNCVIAVENIQTRANYFNLPDPTVVLYWRAGRGLEISKRNRGIPPLVQAIVVTKPRDWRIGTGIFNETWLAKFTSCTFSSLFECGCGGGNPSLAMPLQK